MKYTKDTSPQSASGFELEVDVVVVGAGAGGMATALVAANEGLDVLVVEKTPFVGGSCAYSAGVCWVPANHYAKRAGLPDSREQGLTYLQACIGEGMDKEKIDTYLDRAPEAFEYFEKSEVVFAPRRYTPDYWSELPGSTDGGRALAPLEFDGRMLGERFGDLRRPPDEFMVLGGMMVNAADAENLLHRFKSLRAFGASVRLVLRYLRDRLSYPRGTRLVMGNALAARLYQGLLERKVRVWRDAPVMVLVKDGGRVIGAEVRRDNRSVRIAARYGVVLASGGFSRNEEMRRSLMANGASIHTAAPEGNTGDGIEMGLDAGAVFGTKPKTSAFWSPSSAVQRKTGEVFHFPHLVMDRSKPGVIAVNMHGKRFVNEAKNYHDFARAMLDQEQVTGSPRAYLVCDHRFLESYTLGIVYPSASMREKMVQAGYLLRAETVEGLAGQMGVPVQALRQTVDHYNANARVGLDPDFGKGSTEYNRYLGDSARKPNACLAPVETGPYYAVQVDAGDIGTTYGLSTDNDGRVRDVSGNVIPGLFACGNDMNTIMSGEYPGAGITLGPALTFGYLVAKALSADKSASGTVSTAHVNDQPVAL